MLPQNARNRAGRISKFKAKTNHTKRGFRMKNEQEKKKSNKCKFCGFDVKGNKNIYKAHLISSPNCFSKMLKEMLSKKKEVSADEVKK